MAAQIYKTLAKIAGIVILLLGVAALCGGLYAQSYVADQLGDQGITMPTEESLNGQAESGRLAQEDVDALMPFAGQPMTNGAQAEAFADHYIYAHMKAGAAGIGVPEEFRTYEGLGEYATQQQEALASQIGEDKAADEVALGADSSYPEAQAAAAANELKSGTFFQGNSLRGLLLSAYGWGLLGNIALWAGVALIVVGAAALIGGFVIKPKHTTEKVAVPAAA